MSMTYWSQQYLMANCWKGWRDQGEKGWRDGRGGGARTSGSMTPSDNFINRALAMSIFVQEYRYQPTRHLSMLDSVHVNRNLTRTCQCSGLITVMSQLQNWSNQPRHCDRQLRVCYFTTVDTSADRTNSLPALQHACPRQINLFNSVSVSQYSSLPINWTRCLTIAERPRCSVRYSFRQK